MQKSDKGSGSGSIRRWSTHLIVILNAPRWHFTIRRHPQLISISNCSVALLKLATRLQCNSKHAYRDTHTRLMGQYRFPRRYSRHVLRAEEVYSMNTHRSTLLFRSLRQILRRSWKGLHCCVCTIMKDEANDREVWFKESI